MNIFWLDTDLEKCAQYHCDKHVVKMPLEYAQILSVAAGERNIQTSYKPTHINHPCTRWACKTGGNYTLLYDLAVAVGKEYSFRYGRIHKSTTFILEELPRILDPSELVIRTPLPNCTTLKDYYPQLNLVDKYRLFYMRDKAKSFDLVWTNRERPFFMGDRFYQQQLETIGTCPGHSKEKKPKRLTKKEIAENLGCPAMEKLTVTDLEKASDIKVGEYSIPTGRLKKPYIDVCLEHLDSSIDWGKMTVKELTEVLNKFKK